MKKTILLLFISVFTLSGCGFQSAGAPSGLPAYSGVLISRDGGKTFEPKNYISETESLVRRNILSFAVSHFDTNVLYAGTARDGMYTSRDGGETWVQLDFMATNISVIALNPDEPRTVYAGATWENRGHVFRSDDEGATWKSIYIEPVGSTQVSALAFGPNDPTTIYLGTTKNESSFSTVARSRDGGQTWTNVQTRKENIENIAFDANDVNTIYVIGDSLGVIKSRDGGDTWTELKKLKRTKDQEFYTGKVQSFLAHPREPGVIYAGTNKGFYQSRDYGTSWNEIDIIGTSKGLPIRAIAVHPQDSSRLIYAAAQAVYGKTNDGWAITDTQSASNVSSLTYNPVDSEVIYMTFVRR